MGSVGPSNGGCGTLKWGEGLKMGRMWGLEMGGEGEMVVEEAAELIRELEKGGGEWEWGPKMGRDPKTGAVELLWGGVGPQNGGDPKIRGYGLWGFGVMGLWVSKGYGAMGLWHYGVPRAMGLWDYGIYGVMGLSVPPLPHRCSSGPHGAAECGSGECGAAAPLRAPFPL